MRNSCRLRGCSHSTELQQAHILLSSASLKQSLHNYCNTCTAGLWLAPKINLAGMAWDGNTAENYGLLSEDELRRYRDSQT